MLKVNDRIKIRMYDMKGKEISTGIVDKVFKVYEKNGKLGVDFYDEDRAQLWGRKIFTPFDEYSHTVVFENVDTGEQYHYCTVTRKLEEVRK